MAEKDVVSIEYLKNHERFADVINTYQFGGKQVIQASDIYERDPREDMPQMGSLGMERMHFAYEPLKTSSSKRKSIVVTGDISRKVGFDMKVAIVTIEQQSEIHYAMPVRVMVEDGANYHQQWSNIRKEHKEKKDLTRGGAEYLSGFTSQDRLIPVYTIVVYWGREPWTGPRCLKDMLDLEGLEPEIITTIADYPLNILEARTFENYEMFQTDLRLLFGFLQRDQNKEALSEFIEANREQFENLAEDTYDMIGQFSNTKELDKKKNEHTTKKGAVNMCKALEDMQAMSEQKGQQIGQQIGKQQGKLIERCTIIRKLSSTMTIEQLVEVLQYDRDFVLKVLELHTKYPQKTEDEFAAMLS